MKSTERRFRDMRLTEDEVEFMVNVYASRKEDALLDSRRALTWKFLDRARRLLPLWRKWAIERERLWFALIGLGLDIEGDSRDMPRAEMRTRLQLGAMHWRLDIPRYHFIMRELDQ